MCKVQGVKLPSIMLDLASLRDSMYYCKQNNISSRKMQNKLDN